MSNVINITDSKLFKTKLKNALIVANLVAIGKATIKQKKYVAKVLYFNIVAK